MKENNAFEMFAPAILQVYNRDKEAFWKVVMAPYLSEAKLSQFFVTRKTGMEILGTFKGLDDDAEMILKEFSRPLGFDVTTWKSYRAKADYFKDAYPIFAFLVIWMHEQGLNDFLETFKDILKAAVFGIAGYGILDVNVDGKTASPVEILTAQALIAEYETQMLQVFGFSSVNLGILHRMRSLFLGAEIKEKSVRWNKSPYHLENPKECCYKAAHLLTPFMLCLERLDKSNLIEDYFEVFFLFGAVIQIIDDWKDLEDDLSVGHFSYVTLGFEQLLNTKKPREMAKLIRGG